MEIFRQSVNYIFQFTYVMRPEIQHALAKTLVNRRIYWLLRPVWLQEIRYAIQNAQLYERLCGLVAGTCKQNDIRRLDIVLDETHVHLFALALARLPRLTDLRLFLKESELDSNYKVLLTALERHLTAGHRFDELEIESDLAMTDHVVEECFYRDLALARGAEAGAGELVAREETDQVCVSTYLRRARVNWRERDSPSSRPTQSFNMKPKTSPELLDLGFLFRRLSQQLSSVPRQGSSLQGHRINWKYS